MQEYTISGIIGQKYGESTRFVVSIIAIYALITVVVVAYTGGAVVLGNHSQYQDHERRLDHCAGSKHLCCGGWDSEELDLPT